MSRFYRETTLTHCFVHNWAIAIGFRVIDIFILNFTGARIWNSNLTQRHARKYHCYWIVLQKKGTYNTSINTFNLGSITSVGSSIKSDNQSIDYLAVKPKECII